MGSVWIQDAQICVLIPITNFWRQLFNLRREKIIDPVQRLKATLSAFIFLCYCFNKMLLRFCLLYIPVQLSDSKYLEMDIFRRFLDPYLFGSDPNLCHLQKRYQTGTDSRTKLDRIRKALCKRKAYPYHFGYGSVWNPTPCKQAPRTHIRISRNTLESPETPWTEFNC